MNYSFYEGFFRPCLFCLDAERAHNLTIKGLELAGHCEFTTKLISQQVEQRPCKVMGITFPNPVGLAAGLDKDGCALDALGALGFGFLEIGTVTPKAQPGNPAPRMFRVLPANGIINHMGFNNLGVDNLIGNIRKSRYNGVLGINIGKNKVTPLEKAVDDYLYCLDRVYEYASYVTINISSPNTPDLRKLQHGAYLENLLSSIKNRQKELNNRFGRYVPIAVKIAPDLSNEEIHDICSIFMKYEIDCIIATNTTLERGMINGMPHASEEGGLSGSPLLEKSTAVLKQVSSEVKGQIPIIGVGGVDSPMAAREKFENGASLVQIFSGFIYHGPQLIKKIVSYV